MRKVLFLNEKVHAMRIGRKPKAIYVAGMPIRLARCPSGTMELWADTEAGLAAGIGLAHAIDRFGQMSLAKLLGQGRLSECLSAGREALHADIFARNMGFAHFASCELDRVPEHSLSLLEAYCLGVNHVIRHGWRPFEMRLWRYSPETWRRVDSLLVAKLIIYFLGHSQREMEHFLVRSIQRGTSVSKLQRLFAPHLDGLTNELIGLIKAIHVNPLHSPDSLDGRIPRSAASNNWAVAGWRTVSGFPIECHDPHLPCNFLPQPWYEMGTHLGDRYSLGVTIPGVPGFLMGRNNDVSFGYTHGFMDMLDYFVEECRAGHFVEDGDLCDFQVRTETIVRRRRSAVTIPVF
ncbi:MAG: penicillin acylase family protein [Pirellulaceae bacterium]